MKRMRTKILGGASIAGFAVAATLALAPAAHAEASLHSGGINASMADGSVRFVSYSIDQATWRAMGTLNGGEVISGDFSAMASRPDGSAHFITQALSRITWMTADTQKDGDALGSEW